MNTRGLIHRSALRPGLACLAVALLLAACQPAAPASPTPPAAETAAPAEPTSTAESEPAPALSLDLSGAAEEWTLETLPASEGLAESPWRGPLPEHRAITLQGYPVTGHKMQAQIFIYPLEDYHAVSEAAAQAAGDLQTLLESGAAPADLPFLPPMNARQVMRAGFMELDFQNGRGVRYLTWYSQGPGRINNAEMFYTFQGITADGAYYVSAILPVTHPDLPASPEVFAEDEGQLADYPAYLVETVAFLDAQPGASFTPDLTALDALIQSLGVR
ncbi:MAG TPA: hypothetical protein GYA06_07425 [Chloroflexi bacterium]|nr:hypothetical protein [Chloroflexota bacterium]